MDWYWVKVCDEFRCAAMKTGIFVEHTEIVKELNVFVDGSITIFLGNISIDPITIGLPKHVKDTSISMWDYLQLVGKCKVCLGKETIKTYKGCHRTQHGDSHDLRCVSSGCQRLLPVITQSSICSKCYSQHTTVLGDGTSPSTSPNGPDFIPGMPENEQKDFNADEAFGNLFPNVSNDLLDLLYSQAKCSQAETLGVDARSRRWPKSVLSLSLSIWIASPAAYRILRGTLFLPCEKLVQIYKNSIDKSPGINFEMCQWLNKECERTHTPKEGVFSLMKCTCSQVFSSKDMERDLNFFGLWWT